MSSYCLSILLKALVWMDSYDLYLFVTYLKISLLRALPYDSENSMFFIMTLGYSLLYGVIIWFLLKKRGRCILKLIERSVLSLLLELSQLALSFLI
jgi:uncharacterized membrane protein YagU involved in acid resistance